jgi:TusA-related sulfurtransferase
MSEVFTVDARGLSCPEPVILTKQAMKNKDVNRIDVLVDSGASRDNVVRAAERAGWTVQTEELPGFEFRLKMSR